MMNEKKNSEFIINKPEIVRGSADRSAAAVRFSATLIASGEKIVFVYE
jgi:hypothetical protein